jgi:hypothetical protein
LIAAKPQSPAEVADIPNNGEPRLPAGISVIKDIPALNAIVSEVPFFTQRKNYHRHFAMSATH